MALKYISHGNTYDGDGTTKDAAASAGAVGAWNDLIAIMSAAPTYGTLVAGDIVNIRSKISGTDVTIVVVNGADVAVLERGNLADGQITWFADDGTIWTGDDGKLTLQIATADALDIKDYNTFKGKDQNLEIVSTVASNVTHNSMIWYRHHVVMDDCIIHTRYSTTHTCYVYAFTACRVTFINCLLWEGTLTGTYHSSEGHGGMLHFYNCEFKTDHSSKTSVFVSAMGIINSIKIVGGKTTGMNTDRYLCSMGDNYYGLTKIEAFGFQCDCNLRSTVSSNPLFNGPAMFSDQGSNPFDMFSQIQKGSTVWIRGDSFPYLNATLPDTTPYSLRVETQSSAAVYVTNPFFAADLVKYYDSANASKKITLEILIDSALSSPLNAEYVMEVGYLATDDEYKVEHTTIDMLNTLATSTASWNTTTYKTRSHTKYKLELTTASSIKQYSNVTVRLKIGKSQNSNYYIFVDPDFIIGAP